METVFLSLVCLLGGLWEAGAISVTGELGKSVTITCSHINAHTNYKYFCKDRCETKDVLISTRDDDKGQTGRYGIRDEGNTFSVTISDLKKDDAGKYWCGIDRIGWDTYKEVDLTVVEKHAPESSSDEKMNADASTSNNMVYIGAGLGVAVLALALLLLIFFKHRRRHITESSGTINDTIYATPCRPKQDEGYITTSCSAANKDQETDGETDSVSGSSCVQPLDGSTNCPGCTYDNISGSEHDALLYSTLSFSERTDCGAAEPHSEAATYSAVNCTSADESAVYSNI
ncbi:uncharacterized protein V6R79_009111 [Siganus canaliculatus]